MVDAVSVNVVRNVEFIIPDGYCLIIHYLCDHVFTVLCGGS